MQENPGRRSLMQIIMLRNLLLSTKETVVYCTTPLVKYACRGEYHSSLQITATCRFSYFESDQRSDLTPFESGEPQR